MLTDHMLEIIQILDFLSFVVNCNVYYVKYSYKAVSFLIPAVLLTHTVDV